jgi:hypothetical protein
MTRLCGCLRLLPELARREYVAVPFIVYIDMSVMAVRVRRLMLGFECLYCRLPCRIPLLFPHSTHPAGDGARAHGTRTEGAWYFFLSFPRAPVLG